MFLVTKTLVGDRIDLSCTTIVLCSSSPVDHDPVEIPSPVFDMMPVDGAASSDMRATVHGGRWMSVAVNGTEIIRDHGGNITASLIL